MSDANRSSILRFQHVLEASVVFAVVASIADVSHLALVQPRLASDPLASLRLITTVSVLTGIPYLVILSVCFPIVRWISRAANRSLDLSLTLIYLLAALPAGVILLRSVAISVAEQSAILAEVKILVYFLKYVFLLVPMCWALGAWLSEIRTKMPYAQLLGRASGLCFAALVFLILTPMLLTRYSTGSSTAQNASTEGLIIVGGTFVLSILVLPLAIRVAAALAGSRKGVWLGIVWIAALILPFVPPVVHGPSVVGTPPTGAQLSGRPANVILVSIDTLRADDLGCYGSEIVQTPDIDSVARDAVVFDNAVTPMPMTGPAHMSMMTGLQPDEKIGHGVKSNGIVLPRDIPTLASVLNDRGFSTAAVIGGSPLTRQASGLERGFNYYQDIFDESLSSRIVSSSLRATAIFRIVNKLLSWGGVGVEWVKKPADRVTDQALGWLKTHSNRPFFLFVHYYDPHTPLNPPPPFDSMYSPSPNELPSSFRDSHPVAEGWNEPPMSSNEMLAARRAVYRGEVSFADRELGRLVDWCSEAGVLDNTLLIITADHGECFEENYVGHIDRLYESIVNVPLIIRNPDLMKRGASGERVNALVDLSDIFFTALAFLDIEPPQSARENQEKVPGSPEGWNHDLAGLISDRSQMESTDMPLSGWAFVAMQSYTSSTSGGVPVGRLFAYRFPEGKLIYGPDAQPYLPTFQYFELQSDPGETRDLFPGTDWGASHHPVGPTSLVEWADQQGSVQEGQPMDPTVLESLRALGYVQ